MPLRVSEIYLSVQGEGPNTGKPTIFVRFAGCNLKCPGWPCDTQHAINPKIFMHESTVYGTGVIDAKTIDILASEVTQHWYDGVNICLTGGEVLLQPTQDLEHLLDDLQSHTLGGGRIEMFTNGTFRMSRQFRSNFDTIVMDWKLAGSGEKFDNQRLNNMFKNLELLGDGDALKFTIANEADFDEACQFWAQHVQWRRRQPAVYCGAVWGLVKEAQIAEWILQAKLPWLLNVQMHKYIWDSEARGT